MKSAFSTTLIMLIFALAASGAAAYYYPWPEVEVINAKINQPLFEEYDLDQVRSMQVRQFNGDRNELETIRLRRKADKWIFENKDNFVATNAALISLVRSSLNDRKVREFMSDQEEDHIKYGVVDPVNHETSVLSSLGSKLVLEDRQGQVIASLIVGKAVKSESGEVQQRFVRVPEQPNVYVVDFDKRLLVTDFSPWNDPNLLKLQSQTNPLGESPVDVMIDGYRIDPEKLAEPDSKESFYQARFNLKGNQLGFDSLKVSNKETGAWEDLKPNDEQMQAMAQWTRAIGLIRISDVRRKSKSLISALRNPKADTSEEVLKSLEAFGFKKTGFANRAFEFDATGGKFVVVVKNGVRYNLHIGTFDTSANNSGSGNLARYLMITVDVDAAQFPEIEVPEDPQDRAYLRAVEQRKKGLTQARQVANDLNRQHADWFYVVDEEILSALVPTLNIDLPAKTDAAEGDETSAADGEDKGQG